jgi:hypothetical protein
MKDANVPDFIIVGAAKSGTTSLFHALGGHENVWLPDMKEPEYFAYGTREMPNPNYKDVVVDFSQYRSLFNGARRDAITGEASPAYLYFSHVAGEIWRELPDVKLIAILRHPVDRAYSHYHNARRAQTEPIETFRQAANAEREVLDREWEVGEHPRSYLRFSLYGEQLQRYYDRFPESQIKVISFEHFIERPQRVLGEVLSFLGFPEELERRKQEKRNSGFSFRSYRLYKALQPESAFSRTFRSYAGDSLFSFLRSVVTKLNRKPVPPLNPEVRDALSDVFAEDVQRVRWLSGKQFERWDL